MPVNAQSTDAEVQAAIENNAGYRAAGSVSMAVEFAIACRIWAFRVPTMGSQDGQTASFPVYIYADQLKDAEQFIAAARSAGSGNRLIDLRDCRE